MNVSLLFKREEHHNLHKQVIVFKRVFLHVSVIYTVDEMEHTKLNKTVFWKVKSEVNFVILRVVRKISGTE